MTNKTTYFLFLSMIFLAGCANSTIHHTQSPPQDIWVATCRGDAGAVRSFLDKGFSANAKNKHDITPLQYAAFFYNAEIAQILISKGAKTTIRNSKGETPLHYLALNEQGVVLPWHDASVQGKKGVIKLLVSNGADINAKDKYGHTPLHTAIRAGNIQNTKLLLEMGADIEAKNLQDETSIAKAVDYGRIDIVEFLITKGADLKVKDRAGHTLLDLAAMHGHKKIEALLQKHGVKKSPK